MIKFYFTSPCPDCDSSKDFYQRGTAILKERGIDHDVVNVNNTERVRKLAEIAESTGVSAPLWFDDETTRASRNVEDLLNDGGVKHSVETTQKSTTRKVKYGSKRESAVAKKA